MSDSNYIVTGAFDTSAALNFQGKGFIAKLTKYGALMWQKTFKGLDASPYCGFVAKAIEINVNQYIVLGSKNLLSNPDPANAWLVRVDGIGNFVWERTYNYQGGNFNAYAYNISRTTSDNGFILTGSVFTPGQDLWLLKLDSVGCEFVNCTVGLEESTNFIIEGFNIYPNPFNNYATITCNVPPTCKKAEIIIYDITGKRVATLPINSKGYGEFQFSNILESKGLYLFNLEVDNVIVDHKKVVVLGE